ncbi:GlxA family transcriptional regulator [Actinomadura gamaensis]|uniref:GlxA family transcriptional regulator n=1 Tax=Actinomadura gamaensis TaxID=1763541 RepID=A0ABV9TYU2_9ACTN
MHTVAILALDETVAFDMAVPIEVFNRVRLPDGRRPYRVRVCGTRPEVPTETFTVHVPWGLEALADADTVVVPGRAEHAGPPPAEALEALRDAAARGTRIASICGGAFTLAATGLLDGLAATTHWTAARRFAEMFPKVEVRPDVLYVDNGQLLTSAGASAGLDLCLHLVRRDLGSAVAADAARLAVTPLEREGGQAQYIVHDRPPLPRGSLLEPTLAWIEDHLARDLTLEDMAAHCGVSPRTFNRRFREHTGTTPLQWLLRVRVTRAQFLLEHTDHPVERIALQAGFGSATAFRERFKRVTGTTPNAYRAAFRGSHGPTHRGAAGIPSSHLASHGPGRSTPPPPALPDGPVPPGDARDGREERHGRQRSVRSAVR